MLKLFSYASAVGLRHPSPFCRKAEVLLRMAGVHYDVVDSGPGKSPTKKLPAISDGDRVIPDSNLIQRYLEDQHGLDIDAGLSPQELAICAAFRRLIEEHLYWTVVHARWLDPLNEETTKMGFFGTMPGILRGAIFAFVKREVRKALHGHGIGRHSVEEIEWFGRADIAAISDYLGDKPFFMGDAPRSIDATVFAFVEGALADAFRSPIREFAESRGNLPACVLRMRDRYFPEDGGSQSSIGLPSGS